MSARVAQDAPRARSQEGTRAQDLSLAGEAGGSGCSRLPDGGAWAVADWKGEEGTSGPPALGVGELSALE